MVSGPGRGGQPRTAHACRIQPSAKEADDRLHPFSAHGGSCLNVPILRRHWRRVGGRCNGSAVWKTVGERAASRGGPTREPPALPPAQAQHAGASWQQRGQVVEPGSRRAPFGRPPRRLPATSARTRTLQSLPATVAHGLSGHLEGMRIGRRAATSDMLGTASPATVAPIR